MGFFRMGQWALRRPMVSEGKTPFAPRVPELRAGGFHRLRRDEGLLTVSDRAVDPGQQRPSPRWGVAGASCNARSGCARLHARVSLRAGVALCRRGFRLRLRLRSPAARRLRVPHRRGVRPADGGVECYGVLWIVMDCLRICNVGLLNTHKTCLNVYITVPCNDGMFCRLL